MDFIETPLQNHPPHVPRFALDEIQRITVEVQTMLDKGAIEKTAQSPDQFVGHIFLRPKKNGTFRPVFNLKPLNRFIRYEHFKMEGMQMLSSMLQNGDWMCTLDIKDAYFCVAVGQNHQKYLRFLWNNQMYQYKSIPFGLGSAPRTFTNLLKPVVVLPGRPDFLESEPRFSGERQGFSHITVDTPTTITYVMVVTKMAEGWSLRRVLCL